MQEGLAKIGIKPPTEGEMKHISPEQMTAAEEAMVNSDSTEHETAT